MPRFLVIANKTLVGPEVRASILERATEDAIFHILVPDAEASASDSNVGMFLPAAGTGSAAFPAGVNVDAPASPSERADGARVRLREVKTLVMGTGAEVYGTICPPDSMDSIREMIEAHEFDEIVLSTLPSGISRWLRQDLPSRVRRAFDGPVTVIDARPPAET